MVYKYSFLSHMQSFHNDDCALWSTGVLILDGVQFTYFYFVESFLTTMQQDQMSIDSDAGRDWGQEEKGMTEDEMAGWHH